MIFPQKLHIDNSMLRHLPLGSPNPDVKKFIAILKGEAKSQTPPLVEYIIDDAVRKPIITELLGRRWVEDGPDRETQRAYLDNLIEFWRRLGYDFVRFERGLGFRVKQIFAPDTAAISANPRGWAEEHSGCIQDWTDFERYPWPAIEEMDFFPFEYLDSHLPDGMGLLTCHAGGIFEHLTWIMSLEGLCLALIENPGLVKAVSDKIGTLLTEFSKNLLDLDHVEALFAGDDMGFRSATLISPSDLRKYCLPWHRQITVMAHEKDKPYFLHSCGNIEAIMEDLIADVRIDGKHSFEDAFLPVGEFQSRYGRRIAVLGGLDVHILASSSPAEVRQKTGQLLDTCGRRGRYAVGSGNSIPSYVPVANYLAMIDEALERA